MKRKLASLLAAAALLALIPLNAFGASGISVTVDDKSVVFPDSRPYIDQNDRTLVPVSPIAQAMGMTYHWDGQKQTATFTKNYTADTSPLVQAPNESYSSTCYLGKETVTFTIGSKNVIYSAYFYDISDLAQGTPLTNKTAVKTISMDTTAVLRNSRTYAPVKYLAETLGYSVIWRGSSNTVAIYSDSSSDPLMRFEFLGADGSHFSFAAFKGRLFDAAGVQSIKFNGAKIGTENCAYQNFSDQEIASIKATYGDDYLTGTRITEKFFSGQRETLDIYFTITYKTGLTESSCHSVDYTYSGSGSTGSY